MPQAVYQIDPAHTAAHFTVRHMMITNVRGEFAKVSGKFVWDPEKPADLEVEAVIDATSIRTRDAQRDAHLKSADFFDIEKFPEITFRSRGARVIEGGLEVSGDLTIHGHTREVALEVEGPTPEAKDPWGFTRIGATITTRIHRKDFGLTWNAALETGGVLVGDEVKIAIDVEGIRQ